MTCSKRAFVEEELFFLLCSANSNIADVAYYVENGNESVKVIMNNGCTYAIDITGDSLLAIAKDVVQYMMYR